MKTTTRVVAEFKTLLAGKTEAELDEMLEATIEALKLTVGEQRKSTMDTILAINQEAMSR